MKNHVPSQLLANRRERLSSLMALGSKLILLSNETQFRNADIEYHFRQNSDYWYFTGIDTPDSVFILTKDLEGGVTEQLFIQDRDEVLEKWLGKRLDKDEAKTISGMQVSGYFSDFKDNIDRILLDSGCTQYYFDSIEGSYSHLREQISRCILGSERRGQKENILGISKTYPLIRELRMYKDDWEIEQMQKAVKIAHEAHIHAVQTMRETLKNNQEISENKVTADLYRIFGYHNVSWSYPAIVAGGNNACVLHYFQNNEPLNKDELLLIDAGCEYNYYPSDITRAYPIAGKFNTAQAELYDIVLRANELCIEELKKPKVTYRSFHEKSVESITTGLISLGLLKGSLEENIETKKYQQFYMHGVGHYLGLDVHDSGLYVDKNTQRVDHKLSDSVTVTVEPGIYIHADDDSVPEDFRGIGIRIEDNIQVFEDEIKNLSEAIPKSIKDIESICV
jgi:Xaa-Pro aminopeptidase